MTKEKLYTYVGVNGTITTPVHLLGIPAVELLRLTASSGKQLVHNGQKMGRVVTVSVEEDLTEWDEIDA